MAETRARDTADINGTVDLKAPSASPTFTGTVTLPSATSIGNVSSTEVGYLDGVTSAIQTQFGTKATYLRQTATPTGAFNTIWEDTNTTPSTLKIWNGSAWVTFSGAGNADFSDAATGTYSSGGINYKYKTYTGSGSVTITKAGLCDVLIIGGGSGGSAGQSGIPGSGGTGAFDLATSVYFQAGSQTITIGAGGVGAAFSVNSQTGGTKSTLGDFTSAYAESVEPTRNGVGGLGRGSKSGNIGSPNGGAGITSTITNTSIGYAGGGGAGPTGTGTSGGGNGGNTANGSAGTANRGGGGGGCTGVSSTGGNGGSGVVIIRVRTN